MAKGKPIKMSPKHGANPSMALCFFCGKRKGLVLVGKMLGDAKAPKEAIYDYEPCDHCKANMAKGTTLIRVQDTQVGQAPPISIIDGRRLWPTGAWCVISNELANKLFSQSGEPMLVEDEAFDKIISNANEFNTEQWGASHDE